MTIVKYLSDNLLKKFNKLWITMNNTVLDQEFDIS